MITIDAFLFLGKRESPSQIGLDTLGPCVLCICVFVYLCICALICASLVGHNQTHAGHRSTDRAAPVSSGEAEDLLSLSQSLNSHLDFFCKKEGQEQ